MGEYQTKESLGRIIGEHYKTISSKKHDSSRQERMSSLPASEWAVAESQRGMTQDWVKFVWQGKRPERRASSWEVELFTGGWVSCSWDPKRSDTGWSGNYMSRCNTLKNGHLRERKSWAFYRRVSELLLSPKEGWRREWEKWLQDRRRKKKRKV